MKLRSLFIANRGEIAVRIIQAAKALGIRTIQAAKSYLDINAILHAVDRSDADAVHPGYGFLSENSRFAAAVETAGKIFVGPDTDTIARMGDKGRSARALCASAVALAKRVDYRNAGTLEYLYDNRTQEFFFIEMNTRIQVEHPVTEAITGVDLVQAQLRIAGGEQLWLYQHDITRRGHAIEVRINAENPAKMFMPSPGQVTDYAAPTDASVRFDTLLYKGCRITPYYDSLVGKLIVWGPDRNAALTSLRAALAELKVDGVHTTAPLHQALAADPEVRTGNFHTTWLETWMDAV